MVRSDTHNTPFERPAKAFDFAFPCSYALRMPEISLTKSELVRIVCRAFALYLLLCALIDFTYYPQYMNSLLHHLQANGSRSDDGYWTRYYVLETASLTVRSFGLLLGGLTLWNPGARIVRFFDPSEGTSNPPAAPESPVDC